jgi:hypothetical protein
MNSSYSDRLPLPDRLYHQIEVTIDIPFEIRPRTLSVSSFTIRLRPHLRCRRDKES